jgi:hypothetical protein
LLAAVKITRKATPGILAEISGLPFIIVIAEGLNPDRVQMNVPGEDGHRAGLNKCPEIAKASVKGLFDRHRFGRYRLAHFPGWSHGKPPRDIECVMVWPWFSSTLTAYHCK